LSPPHFHPGTRHMVTLLHKRYNWKGLHEDVRDYLSRCLTCQRNRPLLHRPLPNRGVHPIKAPFCHIYMDIWGPVQWNGRHYSILTIMDHFTKNAEAIALTSTTSTDITRALFVNWISRYGSPITITTDNALAFISPALNRLCKMLGITPLRTTIYHPQGNSPVERFHQTLKKAFKYLRLCTPLCQDITIVLAWALMMYRLAPHSVLRESPGYMTYGCDPVLRGSDFETADYPITVSDELRLQVLLQFRQDLVVRHLQTQADTLQNNQQSKDRLFHRGDLVLLHLTPLQHRRYAQRLGVSAKLTSEWSLPMRVTFTNASGRTATVTCITTGYTTTTHLERVRFVQQPTTQGLQDEWDSLLNHPVTPFPRPASAVGTVQSAEVRTR
jgi:transposase InsO family protein